MAAAKAALTEVFHSIQGEGRHVGLPMSFVRVATCPIRCLYCDTPYSYVAQARFPVRSGGGDAGDRSEPNPVTAARAARLASDVAAASPFGRSAGARRVVSVTGGEPLVYPDFVLELGRALATDDRSLHLETATLDPAALQRALPVVAHLSADYKLPGTLARGDHQREHVACLELAGSADCTIDVKLVLTEDVAADSLRAALDRLEPFRARILLVLQPVTPFGAVRAPLSAERLRTSVADALERGFDCRVLPQAHKALGVD